MAAEVRPSGSSGRPWYLVLALLVCSGLGACGATEGWDLIEFYRGNAELEVTHDLAQSATHEDERKMIQAAVDKRVAALDAERARVFPLAAAELVIGLALFVFAAGAMMRRAGARRAVVQLAIAQAILVIATFALTPKLRWTHIDIALAQTNAKALAGADSEVIEQLNAVRIFYRGLSVVWLVVRAGIAVLIVVALTRRRTLAFYAAQNEPEAEG